MLHKAVYIFLFSLIGCATLFFDVNEQDEKGETLLLRAAAKCSLIEVKQLVEKGANRLDVALMYATVCPFSDESNPWQYTNIMSKVDGKFSSFKYPIEKKGYVRADENSAKKKSASISRLDEQDWKVVIYTPINLGSGNLEMVKYLVEKGADINMPTRGGYSRALMYASAKGNLEIVKYLVEKGAKINISSDEDFTPLMYASNFGNLEIVTYLIEKGATINSRGDYGPRPPLMFAAYNGHFEIVKFLVEKKANVNVKDVNGKTALMYADGYPDIQEFLLKKGADKSYALEKSTSISNQWTNIFEENSKSKEREKPQITKDFCLKWADKASTAATPKNSSDYDRACSQLWKKNSADHDKCVDTWKSCMQYY